MWVAVQERKVSEGVAGRRVGEKRAEEVPVGMARVLVCWNATFPEAL